MKGQREYGVIGLGRFGTAVATTLHGLGHTVLGIDRDMARVQHVTPLITNAAQADCTDEDALRALGFRNLDAAIVSVGPDLESSILATVLVKELGVPYVVAKAKSALHGKILERVGADRVVYPERLHGHRTSNVILTCDRAHRTSVAGSDYGGIRVAAGGRQVWPALGWRRLRSPSTRNQHEP